MNVNTEWFKDAGWGLLLHYLAELNTDSNSEMSIERWNQQVDAFDTQAFADQLKSVGVSYVILTIGQNSGYYIAPNATYDAPVGRTPSRCSRRDLVADLHVTLSNNGSAHGVLAQRSTC